MNLELDARVFVSVIALSPSRQVFSEPWGSPLSAECTHLEGAFQPSHHGPSEFIQYHMNIFLSLHIYLCILKCYHVLITSASLVLNCPGCFLANSRMTSGVLNAWLMAAWIAWYIFAVINYLSACIINYTISLDVFYRKKHIYVTLYHKTSHK